MKKGSEPELCLTNCPHALKGDQGTFGLVALQASSVAGAYGNESSNALIGALSPSLRKRVCSLDMNKEAEHLPQFLQHHKSILLLDTNCDSDNCTIGIVDLGGFLRRNPRVKEKSERLQQIYDWLKTIKEQVLLPHKIILVNVDLPRGTQPEVIHSAVPRHVKNLAKLIEKVLEAADQNHCGYE
jgi:hypothetical protein